MGLGNILGLRLPIVNEFDACVMNKIVEKELFIIAEIHVSLLFPICIFFYVQCVSCFHSSLLISFMSAT